MPDQTPPQPPVPPSMPPMPPAQPLPYHTPGMPPPQPPGAAADATQRVFDTVTGPNLRLRDNLIQLACVIVGGVVGAVVGRMVAADDDSAVPLLVGALVGLVASLLISGLVIGIVRGKRAPAAVRIPENPGPVAHLNSQKVKGADVSGRGMEGLAWESLIEEQIRQNGRLFFRLAYNVLRDSPAAEDVCQQAFLRACEQRQQILHNAAALKAWLVRTVINGSLQTMRRGKVERRTMQDQARSRPTAADPPGAAGELREIVLAALGHLPEQTRLVVALRVMEGLAGNEVKDLLGCSATEVSRQLHRGLEQLRGIMVEGETDAVG